ncbi:MAG: DoxX family protein [Acidobacteriota bacterium]|nr:DoxX family protein [Blastocatellia bacterium]MDW8411161.1 DoxX family protein [Acidobacteriota bacterium]
MKTFFYALYDRYIQTLNKMQDLLLLAVRLYWGWQFFQTGKGKLLNIDRTAAFFADLGLVFPKANAILVGCVEAGCGLLLLLGLGARIFSAPLVATMFVAYLTAHMDVIRDKGQWIILNNPDAFVSAPPFLFLFASLIVLIFGPGKISLDNAVTHYFKKANNTKQEEEKKS